MVLGHPSFFRGRDKLRKEDSLHRDDLKEMFKGKILLYEKKNGKLVN